MKRSPFDISDQLVRREIVDPKEKDYVKGTESERINQEIQKQVDERKTKVETQRAQDAIQRESGGHEFDEWQPPVSEADLATRIAAANPLWNMRMVLAMAKAMWERYGLIRAALLAGLANGRDYRERLEHGLGIPLYPEMEPLTPMERGVVINAIKKHTGAKCVTGVKS